MTAQAGDSADPQHSGTRTLKVKVGLGVEPAALAGGDVGAPYEATLEVIGGSGSYSFGVSEGTLPKGLELDAATGTISGTPTEAGKSKFTIAVTDLVTGITATVNYHVTVAGNPFPATTFEFKETSGGEPFDTDEIAFTLTRNHGGLMSGTMEDSDKSVGSWFYNPGDHAIEFHWIEGNVFEPHQSAGELFTGTCEPVAGTCAGVGALDEHEFTLGPPE